MLALVPEVAPRGHGFARGAWPFIGQFYILSILCACVRVCIHARVCACMRACVRV